MAQELINIGVTADDGTGDTIRGAGIKINNNFTELYARPSVASDINVVQNNISTTASNADIVLKPSGTGGTDMTTIEKAEGYLAHKWGHTSALETSHPYKYIAP